MKTIIKTLMFVHISFCILFVSCENEDINLEEVNINSNKDNTQIQFNENDKITTIEYNGQLIEVQETASGHYYFGDIIINKDESQPVSKSVGKTGDRWSDGKVYYLIDGIVSDNVKTRIADAIRHWETNTSLEFIVRRPGDQSQKDYIKITRDFNGGCRANVGKIGGLQHIWLSDFCSTGDIIPEIGHSVGLYHEHNRADRDQYIIINYDNIHALSHNRLNFQTYAEKGEDGDEFTDELDFNSIMMYDSYAFSGNEKPTIVKKDGSVFTTQRNGLSVGDLEGIRRMYPPTVDCTGVEQWISVKNYEIGERMVFEGNLYEETGSSWSFIGKCG